MKIEMINGYPILVADDFLSLENARSVLEECWRLEPFFEPATVGEEGRVDLKIRQNDVIYMDDFFGGGLRNRHRSVSLKLLDHHVFNEKEIQEAIGNTYLSLMYHTNHSEAVLSRYGKCDFYGWHQDPMAHAPHNRIITVIYYVNTEPEMFNGGDITLRCFKNILKEGKFEDITIKPKHNRLVIFPSHFLHKVTNVTIQSQDPKDWRFSFNFWCGFKGAESFQQRP